MNELAELQAQHTAGHGPSGICGGPERCASARYLAVIERQQGQLAEWQAISEEQAEIQRQSNVDLAAAADDLDRLEEQEGRLEQELMSKRWVLRGIYQCRLKNGNGTICRACCELAEYQSRDHTALAAAP